MTIAIAEGIMNGGKGDDRASYGSLGNVVAKRISPCSGIVNSNNSSKDDLLENN